MGNCVELLLRQIGENGNLGEQSARREAEIESGAKFDLRARVLDFATQRTVQLRSDHPLLEQGAIFVIFAAQSEPIQEAAFQQIRIRWILLAQGLQRRAGHVLALMQNFVQLRGHAFTEQRRQLFIDVWRQLSQYDPVYQQQFETIGERIDQWTVDPEPAMEEVRDPESSRKFHHSLRRAQIPGAPLGSRAIDQPSHVRQQLLDDAARNCAL